jgi:hypothetical protein
MRSGLDVEVDKPRRFTIDGAIDVDVFVRRVTNSRWEITLTDSDDASRAFDIRYDPALPLDAWSVHPPHSAQEWASFPTLEAALRFASILHEPTAAAEKSAQQWATRYLVAVVSVGTAVARVRRTVPGTVPSVRGAIAAIRPHRRPSPRLWLVRCWGGGPGRIRPGR